MQDDGGVIGGATHRFGATPEARDQARDPVLAETDGLRAGCRGCGAVAMRVGRRTTTPSSQRWSARTPPRGRFCDGLIGTATPPAYQTPYSTATYAAPLGSMVAPGRRATPPSMRDSADRAACLPVRSTSLTPTPQRSATDGVNLGGSARKALTLVIATTGPTNTNHFR